MRIRLLSMLSIAAIASSSGADPLHHLEGDLRSAATPALFSAIGEVAGSFSLDASEASEDLRLHPGRLVISTPNGTLTAEASANPRLDGARRVDPVSGRPLKADSSPDATCSDGSQPACWHTGDPLAGNVAVFDALCAATVGSSQVDRSACALRIGNSSLNALTGQINASPMISEVLGTVTSGSATGRNLVLAAFIPGAGSFPTVRSNLDPNDGPGSGVFGSNSLSQGSTDSQESLLGCGAFWGTSCDVSFTTSFGGIDLLVTEASVLTQAWPGPPNTALDWNAADAGVAQPGTVGFGGSPAAQRFADDALVTIAGARGPLDAGWDPTVDGCVLATDPGCSTAATNLEHPYSHAPFASEAAAVSWNYLLTLVAFSREDKSSFAAEVPCEDGQDPATCRTASEFIANANFTLRTDGCSYAKPQLCSNVIAFASLLTTTLSSDPADEPHTRWLWESGAEYEITETTGDLAEFLGGVAHVLGPEPARSDPTQVGIPVILVPPDGSVPNDASPLVGATGPGSGGTAAGLGFGFAYGVTVPEPGSSLAGAAALAALGLRARRRNASARAESCGSSRGIESALH